MEFKKFNAKKWRNHYKKVCESMNDEELYKMYKGISMIYNILVKYSAGKYGSGKRLDDISEYLQYPAEELLKRVDKKQEVPY